MSRRNTFIEDLKKNQAQVKDMIFYCEDTQNLFKDTSFTVEEEENFLTNLIAYLPCSRRIIDEYLKRFSYPQSNDADLFDLVKDILNREKKHYKILMNDIFGTHTSEVSRGYADEVERFNTTLSDKNKEAIDLKIKIKNLKDESEKLRIENEELEGIDLGSVQSEIGKLKEIRGVLLNSKKLIDELKKRVR